MQSDHTTPPSTPLPLCLIESIARKNPRGRRRLGRSYDRVVFLGTVPLVKLKHDGNRLLVIGHPEASKVVARLHCREGEVPRLHVLHVVHVVLVWKCHLQCHQSKPNASISPPPHTHTGTTSVTQITRHGSLTLRKMWCNSGS
jgi:hypothetical protein